MRECNRNLTRPRNKEIDVITLMQNRGMKLNIEATWMFIFKDHVSHENTPSSEVPLSILFLLA